MTKIASIIVASSVSLAAARTKTVINSPRGKLDVKSCPKKIASAPPKKTTAEVGAKTKKNNFVNEEPKEEAKEEGTSAASTAATSGDQKAVDLEKLQEKINQSNGGVRKNPPIKAEQVTPLTEELIHNFENALANYEVTEELEKHHGNFRTPLETGAALATILAAWQAYQESLLKELVALAKKAFEALPGVDGILEQLRNIINILCEAFRTNVLGNLNNLPTGDKKDSEEDIIRHMKTQVKETEPKNLIQEMRNSLGSIKKMLPKAGEEVMQPLTNKQKEEGRKKFKEDMQEIVNEITDTKQKENANKLLSEIDNALAEDAMNNETDGSKREEASNKLALKFKELAEAVAGKKIDAGEKLQKVDAAAEKFVGETTEKLTGPCNELVALFDGTKRAFEIQDLWTRGDRLQERIFWFSNRKDKSIDAKTKDKLLAWLKNPKTKLAQEVIADLSNSASALNQYVDNLRSKIEAAELKEQTKKVVVPTKIIKEGVLAV